MPLLRCGQSKQPLVLSVNLRVCALTWMFIIEWLLDTDMPRRAQISLNKDEAQKYSEESSADLPSRGSPRQYKPCCTGVWSLEPR